MGKKRKCDVCGKVTQTKTVTDVTVCRSCLQECAHGALPVPEASMSVEQVKPVDVMTSDLIIGLDKSTGKRYLIYPEDILSLLRRSGLDGILATLCFAFDINSSDHEKRVDEIIRIANGEQP